VASRAGVDYQYRKLSGQDHFWYKLHVVVLIRLLNPPHFPGTAADLGKHRYEWRRSYFIVLICFTFIVSQIVLYNVSSVHTLWMASASLGLGYGGMYGLFPTIMIEWFGLGWFHLFKCLFFLSTDKEPRPLFSKLGVPVSQLGVRRESIQSCLWKKPGRPLTTSGGCGRAIVAARGFTRRGFGSAMPRRPAMLCRQREVDHRRVYCGAYPQRGRCDSGSAKTRTDASETRGSRVGRR
jgi:hypothetical protein